MKIAHGMVIPVCAASLLVVLGGCVTTKSPHLDQGNVREDAAADNVKLAMAYMQEGNLQRAKEKLDRALQEDPTNPNLHSVMAMFYERIDDQKKAEAEIHEAMRLAPTDPGPVLFYGVYLCDQHRVDEGITKMLQVARNPLYRTPEAAYTDMGVCLLTAHRDEEAESAFKRALAARPDYAEGAYQEASLELAHGRALEARDRVQKFISQFNPTPELLLVGLRAARTLGDANGAAQMTKILRAEFPNSEQARSLSADPQPNPG
ncbi:MAG TPA: type IV pilus biogenesis/stability protein PilW [Steroidobacteraceae bacterium]|jgi:type IV pilus assembly protein PilF|nr:type IV pilus biogenesis/stability protein PilW [Steroidobacteraceae bacterium]